jgi:hypothetical protein
VFAPERVVLFPKPGLAVTVPVPEMTLAYVPEVAVKNIAALSIIEPVPAADAFERAKVPEETVVVPE